MKVNHRASATLSLDGEWEFALGDRARWGVIRVPGCWEAQGYSKTAEGPAFYRRTVTIPPTWAGQPIFLEFDAVSYACRVFLNGAPVGEHVGLWTPFALDVTTAALPGVENLLELEIFKPGERYPMRSSLAGFLPDVATTFGGIWQSCRLRTHTHALRDIALDTDPDAGRLHVWGQAVAPQGELTGTVEVLVRLGGRPVAQRRAPVASDGVIDVTVEIPSLERWSPEQPTLYDVGLFWQQAGRDVATEHRRTGFRQLTAAGSQTLLNGAPACLRGVLSWGWDPEVIAPLYTAERVRAEFRRLRELGFNLVKLCLFLPNQTYFDVADQEGMLLWVEFPMWLPEVTPALCAQAPGSMPTLSVSRAIIHPWCSTRWAVRWTVRRPILARRAELLCVTGSRTCSCAITVARANRTVGLISISPTSPTITLTMTCTISNRCWITGGAIGNRLGRGSSASSAIRMAFAIWTN
jgi:beta-galactosidase/beta-glucuronidase